MKNRNLLTGMVCIGTLIAIMTIILISEWQNATTEKQIVIVASMLPAIAAIAAIAVVMRDSE